MSVCYNNTARGPVVATIIWRLIRLSEYPLFQSVLANMRFFASLWLALLAAVPWSNAQTNLISNGRFENGLAGWSTLWTRQPGAGTAAVESFGPTNALKITHTGTNDWSLQWDRRIPVKPGDVFELDATSKLDGPGDAMLCVSTWDAQGQNLSWSAASRTLHASSNWTALRSRFVVPQGVAQIQARFIGSRQSTVWMTGYALVPQPSLESLRDHSLPQQITADNTSLLLFVQTSNATFSILDKRTGRLWSQAATHANVVVLGAKRDANRIELKLLDVSSWLNLTAVFQLDPDKPEFTFQLSGEGELPASLHYPMPFKGEPGDRLIVPMNEGISYPVDDKSIQPLGLIAYGGHGICMALWGVTDGAQGHAAIIETPDDATIQICRPTELLAIAPQWDAQKGRFGYERRLRYVFFDNGGHVAIAKRYRQYAKERGLLKTLAQKRLENTNVDMLVGAVNVWNWDADPVGVVKDLQAAGIDRILWSRGGSPEALKTLNQMNVLTSRYDIYQDVMDPANFPKLQYVHSDWTTGAWPNEIIKTVSGDWLRGWGIESKQKGEWFSCGVICDTKAVDYARVRIPADLATHPYKCRFIDTTTAAPWNECYDPRHPMTRTESREWKMKLLEYVSRDAKQVTGCETGHDASVPFLHYFEGMLSLGPYRVPDAGRAMATILQDVPESVAKFQVGQRYRLPLWELVYHDCVVAQWYWGDYNNKLPAIWDKRDLFNLLYGTPPMFMFNKQIWQEQKARFVQSYRNIAPLVRAAGYSEMTDHRILTPDRDVQQSLFANGSVVTVNFGDKPYTLTSGETVPPMGFNVK